MNLTFLMQASSCQCSTSRFSGKSWYYLVSDAFVMECPRILFVILSLLLLNLLGLSILVRLFVTHIQIVGLLYVLCEFITNYSARRRKLYNAFGANSGIAIFFCE